MENNISSSAFRNRRIDFLRGIAILLVLILHFNISYDLSQSGINRILPVDLIKAIASNGNYGVTMFFVISGFLITSTAIERYRALGKIDIVEFYIFRLARIMPCLLLALSIIVLFSTIHIPIFENDPNSTSMFLAVFSVLTFWHNFLMAKIGYFNYCLNILWSLSVEEVFYIAFPIVCLFFKKIRFIIPIWIALIIIAPIYRSLHAHNEIIAIYGYLSCFDAIALGCCAAVIARKIRFKTWMSKILEFGAWALLVAVYLHAGIMQNIVAGFSLIALSTAILLLVANQKQNKSFNPIMDVVCWFGKNSYEFYLFHIIVLALMKEIYDAGALGNYSKLLWLGVFLITSSIVAGNISRFYSIPMNKKLRGFLSGLRLQKQAHSSNIENISPQLDR